jgi:NAD/NADP transhydrogenase beta subunit
MGAGGALGYAVAQKVGPTELPQTVAAFHSLVRMQHSHRLVFTLAQCSAAHTSSVVNTGVQ